MLDRSVGYYFMMNVCTSDYVRMDNAQALATPSHPQVTMYISVLENLVWLSRHEVTIRDCVTVF